MRTRTKILGLVMAAVLLVSASIFTTVAYLTAEDEVTNTFTVGKVSLALDEAKVDIDGQAIVGVGAERVKENSYKLLPGKEYDKDPIVHVGEGSEPAWLFVKVENGIADIEAEEEGYTSIAAQITKNEWTALAEGSNVYYKKYDGGETLDYTVFDGFKIGGEVEGEDLAEYAEAEITITAYAVQAEGFLTAAAAWAATFGAAAED